VGASVRRSTSSIRVMFAAVTRRCDADQTTRPVIEDQDLRRLVPDSEVRFIDS
jgi:hypothetical protein